MSDTALQELRRRAEQDPGARPQLLVARVRAGELHPDRLELAAWVGDRDARTAVDGTPDGRSWPVTLRDVVLGLLHFGEHEVRAAVAAARFALRAEFNRQVRLSRKRANVHADLPEGWDLLTDAGRRRLMRPVGLLPAVEVIELAEAWLADQREILARALEPYCQENELGQPFGPGARLPAWAWSLAAGVLRVSGVDPLIMPSHPSYGVIEAAKEHGEDQVLTAVRDALAGWALGEGARG